MWTETDEEWVEEYETRQRRQMAYAIGVWTRYYADRTVQ